MKILVSSLLALAALSVFSAHAADQCTVNLSANDAMQFDQKEITVSSSCAKITINLAHTGKLPGAVMGHNVVVSEAQNMDAILKGGMKAGAAAHYVPAGDANVVAFTKIIGGGEKASVSFAGKKLSAGKSYVFFCSFPGHSSMMKGKVTVK